MTNKLYYWWLTNRFKRVLKDNEWKNYDYDSDKRIFRFGLSHDKIGELNCLFGISLEKSYCILYFARCNNLTDSVREKAAKYLTYANYGIVLGNFELDLTDGEVRYKISAPIGKKIGGVFSAIPSCKELHHLVKVAISTLARYWPGLIMLEQQPELSVEDICERVEGKRPVSAEDSEFANLPADIRQQLLEMKKQLLEGRDKVGES